MDESHGVAVFAGGPIAVSHTRQIEPHVEELDGELERAVAVFVVRLRWHADGPLDELGPNRRHGRLLERDQQIDGVLLRITGSMIGSALIAVLLVMLVPG
ncbi:hypothetical protein [Streptomyces sp. NPDC054794]